MAGLDSNGLVIKRLQEVIDDRVASTRNYFGSSAGVSINDVLGRAIRVHSASEADIWELAEAVYTSFNPAFATGVSLDRLAQYAGLTRQQAQPSTVSLFVSGDYNTLIPNGSFVDSSVTSNRFITTEAVTLNNTNVSGLVIEVITSQDSTAYTLTLGADTFTYTTGTGESLATIAAGLQAVIDADSDFTATVINTQQIQVDFASVFVPRSATITSNLSYRKIDKLVDAESEEIGPISQPANTIDTIAAPVSGWDSVNNPVSAAEGRFRETDEELRIRFKNSKELNARGTVDAIFANILSVVDVESVQVYENETNATDSNGLPPKSFSVIVQGGNNQTIADTIWDVKPAGIETFGNTTVSTTDSQGISHDISFSRPTPIDIYIDVTISASEGETVAANADTQIIDALEAYFAANFSVGDDVIYSRLYTPINSVQGHQVDSLFIDTVASPVDGTSNIVIAFDEIANFVRGNVTVTIN